VRKQAYIIERIDNQQHKPTYLAAHITKPALDPGAAWMTSRLMEEVLTQGTAASARSLGFKLPAAGKTGTTNDYKDAWFLGYTSTLTCGVWVGFDQPTTIIPHGYGAALALPVWVQVMNKAAQHYPAEPLQPTMPLQHTTVCSISSQLATTGCMGAGTAYDIDLPVDKIPTAACQVHGGAQWPFAQQPPGVPQNPSTLPGRFLRSFRRLFGGR
jgi:penicillin-binding protein 1A